MKIGIVGAGTMGEALIAGLQKGSSPYEILASSPRLERRRYLEERYRVATTEDNSEVVAASETILLCLKPQTFDRVAPALSCIGNRLVVSIMAGKAIEGIATALTTDVTHIARAMPNVPGQIQAGITIWTSRAQMSDSYKETAQLLLEALGETAWVANERFLDIGTAISGSGPAYVFTIMEAMEEAGVALGLPRHLAEKLVRHTITGSGLYAEHQSDKHLAELRNAVTSPGGTTAAALYQLENGRLRTVIADAVNAAYDRARNLG